MQAKKRKIISVCILLFGVVVSFLILSPWSQTQKEKNIEPNIVAGDVTNPRLDFFIKPLANLTDEFTNKSLEKLIQDNEGKISQGIKDPNQLTLLPKKNDVEKIVSDLIEKDLSAEKIDDSEIIISDNNSKELQITYVLFADYLLKKNGEEVEKIQNLEDKSFQERSSLTANQLIKTAEMFKLINVPPSWIDVHKQLVGFFIKQGNIYKSLSAADYDPLRFLVAIKRIAGETENDFATIKNSIQKKIREEKLI